MSKKTERNKEFIDVLISNLLSKEDFIPKKRVVEGILYWDSDSERCKKDPLFLLSILSKKKEKKTDFIINSIEGLREDIDNLYELLDDVREKLKNKENKK